MYAHDIALIVHCLVDNDTRDDQLDLMNCQNDMTSCELAIYF